MAGYSKSFPLGKKPNFLQGEKTSPETKKEVKLLLKQKKAFSKSLVNYRKSGEEYLCHIDVLPLYNANKEATHFPAMEREQFVA